jgi:hypothetical protein
VLELHDPNPCPFLNVSHCWHICELEQVSWQTWRGTIRHSAVAPTRQSVMGTLMHCGQMQDYFYWQFLFIKLY